MSVVDPIESGSQMTAQGVKDRHGQVRAVINALGLSKLLPESIGPQHVEGLVLEAASVEQPSSSAWTVTTHAAVAPEPVAQIIAAWQANPNLLLNNGGAGWTIPKPFILVEGMTYRIDRCDEHGGATLPVADDGVLVNLYKESNGGTAEVSQVVTRYHRVDFVAASGGGSYSPEDSIGYSPTILRVTAYTGVGNYDLDRLQMKAICTPRAAGVGPDAIVRNGRLWFFALRIPG